MKKDKNKKVYIYLIKLYNLTYNKSKIILNDLCIGANLRFKDLDFITINELYKWLEKNDMKLKK